MSGKPKLTYAEARELTDRLKVALAWERLNPQPETEPRRRPSVWTYFIQVQEPDPHGPGPIKIGCAADPHARLRQLQTACPYDLWLMGYVPGGEELERELHKKYAHLRLRNEWFRGDPDLERDLYFMVFDYEDGLL